MGQVGSSPNRIRCHVWAPDGSSLHTFQIRIDGNTRWLEHPLRNQGVDIVGIPIIFSDNVRYTNQVDIQNNDAIPLHVASDLSIVGYPFGLAVNTHLPIWKKGIVASEPNVQVSELDCFYIDATTKEGMSGSPVFTHEYVTQTIVTPEIQTAYQQRLRGELSALEFITALPANSLSNTVQVKKFKLVGIYSGRVTIGTSMPEIGIVWKLSLIDEMLNEQNWVTSEYPPF